MIRVGIINVTGYAGAELARLLYMHPEAEVVSVSGRSAAGKPLAEVFPHLWPLDLKVSSELEDVDFAFSALPHAASAEAVVPLVRRGLPVVDISADFRLSDAAEYERWYGMAHPAPELLAQAVYGLTELHRSAVREARLVANPGCYPTGALLALAPAVKGGIIEPDVVVDAKSGVSGAGRGLGLTYHYAEANESVAAYAMEGHRHLPEIVQELGRLWPKAVASLRVTFQPHLVPMTRGILTTCYAPLADGQAWTKDRVRELYEDFYRGEPFVRVVAEPPQTKHTWGNNLCLVYPTVDTRAGRLVVVSCIDNLVKGAAGQAVQNMNLMLGFAEAAGLDLPAVYP
ncbi:MAG: N-acetyl-gamma-glutamyl-phosphate reductase [Dehalococcoidia bacterium]